MSESKKEKKQSKTVVRTYSRYTDEALRLFAVLIRSARLEQKLTAEDVAERAGTSRSMLQRIEKGDPRCAIGTVFEVANVVGISLFEEDSSLTTLAMLHTRKEEKLNLLPRRARKMTKKVFDDF